MGLLLTFGVQCHHLPFYVSHTVDGIKPANKVSLGVYPSIHYLPAGRITNTSQIVIVRFLPASGTCSPSWVVWNVTTILNVPLPEWYFDRK